MADALIPRIGQWNLLRVIGNIGGWPADSVLADSRFAMARPDGEDGRRMRAAVSRGAWEIDITTRRSRG